MTNETPPPDEGIDADDPRRTGFQPDGQYVLRDEDRAHTADVDGGGDPTEGLRPRGPIMTIPVSYTHLTLPTTSRV